MFYSCQAKSHRRKTEVSDVETSPASTDYTIDDAVSARKVLNILLGVPSYEVALGKKGDGRAGKVNKKNLERKKGVSK
jgi:hypothetical protein